MTSSFLALVCFADDFWAQKDTTQKIYRDRTEPRVDKEEECTFIRHNQHDIAHTTQHNTQHTTQPQPNTTHNTTQHDTQHNTQQ